MALALKAHGLGPAEKLAWEHPFTFRHRPCSIALQKLGMYLYISRQEGEQAESLESTAKEIIGKLSSASRCIEKRVLSGIAKAEIQAGRVTIYNQSGQLRAMYEYFRRLAERAYAGDGLLISDLPNSSASGPTPEAEELARNLQMALGGPIAREREGFYATIAMINAYFSLLEHVLVLSLPATDFDPGRESITGFIGNKLFEKYDRIFDVRGDPQARQFRTRLRGAAEVWRNPYGHGAFDKRHGTLHFQIPDIGPFPAILSDIRSHPTFQFTPDRENSFDEACLLFDEMDAWLRTGPIRHGVRWAESGVSISCDPRFLDRFRSAIREGDGEFEDFLNATAHWDEQATNMDW